MSYQLTANGGEAAYFRLPGSANAVLGFVSSEVTQTYNNTTLGTIYRLQAGDGSASSVLAGIIAVASTINFSMLTCLFNIILLDGGAVPPSGPSLLLESGGFLLLESGGKLLLE